MHRFYWLIDGELAGCSLPGGSPTDGRRAPGAAPPVPPVAAIDADLLWLRQQGIEAVLSLTEEPLPAEALRRHGLESLHLPVDDMTAPTPAQFGAALDFLDLRRASGGGVAVHCLMGQGRTGAVLAAHLIRAGDDVDSALSRLRTLCPGAVSSPLQERALAAFAARRDWIL